VSHFTTLKTRIVSLEHLKAALTDLKMAFVDRPVSIRGYGGQTTQVELKVPTQSPGYDLGFRKQGDTYDLVADWWGIKDIRQGQFVQQLTQRYAYHVAKDQLEAQDFTVVEEAVEQDQTIHICVRRMG
jgi:hypothetical protein